MNLKLIYNEFVVPKLIHEFGYKNKHQVPKLKEIIITSGLGLNAQNKLFLEKAIEEFKVISCQHPVITIAKKSIAGFKIREGMQLGLKVTLRRKKMYTFLEKLIKLALPRIRDFRGLSLNTFDKHGNYHMGIAELLIFPEIEFENIDQIRGCNISIITSTKNNKESAFLLKELGFPFYK